MMFEIESKTLDLNLVKYESEFNNYLDEYELKMFEAVILDDVIEEFTFDDVKNKIKKIGQKIMDAISKFVTEALFRLSTKMQEMTLNSKFKEMKETLLENRSKSEGHRFAYFDAKKYRLYYKDFINEYTRELKKGINKIYKTESEFNEWKDSMIAKLDKFNERLSHKERWTLSKSINEAITLTEDESNKMKLTYKNIKKDADDVIEELTNAVDSRDPFWVTTKVKESFVVYIMRKMAQLVRTVITFITKHLFLCITALIVTVAAGA